MLKKCCIVFVLIVSVALAGESSNDTYRYRSECPQNGSRYESAGTPDAYNFIRCQCTSYVAYKLNELWDFTQPEFTNQYYGVAKWSHARYWKNMAIQSEIGVTGARDNFTWDESSYNAVFYGDIVWWDEYSHGAGSSGHVAFAHWGTPGPGNRGVGCVHFSQYNTIPPFEYSEKTLCRNSDGSFPHDFPDAFLHIDQDRIYCLDHPTVGNCTSLHAGQKVADGPGVKYGGLGGGSDMFNLKANGFGVWNASGVKLIPDVLTVKPGQTVTVKIPVKALNGNTTTHMQPGKDRIEVDIFVRQDDRDWVLLKREYIRASNLSNGTTHTESVTYTIPHGTGKTSFKAKIDAEDEAYEANEGGNWTDIQTFRTDFTWLIPILQHMLEIE